MFHAISTPSKERIEVSRNATQLGMAHCDGNHHFTGATSKLNGTFLWQASLDKQDPLEAQMLKGSKLEGQYPSLNPFDSARYMDPNTWRSTECYQQHRKKLLCNAERERKIREGNASKLEDNHLPLEAPETDFLELPALRIGPDASSCLERLDPFAECENAEFIQKDGKFEVKFLHPINVHQCIENKCIEMIPNGILKLHPYGERPLRALVTVYNLQNVKESYLISLCQQNGLEFVSFRFCGPLGEWKYIASCEGNSPDAEIKHEVINPDQSETDLGFVPQLPIINASQKRHMRNKTESIEVKIEEESVNDTQRSSSTEEHSNYIHHRLDRLKQQCCKQKPTAEIGLSSFERPCALLSADRLSSARVLSNDLVDLGKSATLHSHYAPAQFVALFEVLLRRRHPVKSENGEQTSGVQGMGMQDHVNTEIQAALREIFDERTYDKFLLHPVGYESWIASLEAEGSNLVRIVKDMLPLFSGLLHEQADVGSKHMQDIKQGIDTLSSVVTLLFILRSSSIQDIKDDIRVWMTRYAACESSNKSKTCDSTMQSNISQGWEHCLMRALAYEGVTFTEAFLFMQHTLRYEEANVSHADVLSGSLAYTLLDFYCNGNRPALVDRLLSANADWTLPFITAALLHEDLDFDLPLSEICMRYATQLVREGLFGCAVAAWSFSPDKEVKSQLFTHLLESYKGPVPPM
ncbi:hypothetical protein XU18_4026 [Perkinsela sp. CCAP 1560/4]|nr:hypothetical protein XU18_4026 [Perkinsela sp. CCAP 1560/4]|eukprot:KNH04838.1 hypothetical protein XU18_4026 [Perkinsela sp. CCAP 1560/4]